MTKKKGKGKDTSVLEPVEENEIAARQLMCLQGIERMLNAQLQDVYVQVANNHKQVLHVIGRSFQAASPSKPPSQGLVQKQARQFEWPEDGIPVSKLRADRSVQPQEAWPSLPGGAPEALEDRDSKETERTRKHLDDSSEEEQAAETKKEEKLEIRLTDVEKKAGVIDFKRQIREMFAIDKTDPYKKTGCTQRIVRHPFFDLLTLIVISVNAIWIGIDATFNKADLLIDADLVYIVVENLFCTFFVIELSLRFIAFGNKKAGLSEFWFLFDTTLVVLMIADIWVMLAVTLATSNTMHTFSPTFLRIIRVLKFFRMARLVRLLRNVQEMMILIKGLAVAARAVFFSQLLLFAICYIFAIAFYHILKDTPAGNEFFPDLPEAMFTLFFRATFFEDLHPVARAMFKENFVIGLMLCAFLSLGPLTALNLIVGFVVKVVDSLEQSEQEFASSMFLTEVISKMMPATDTDKDVMIKQDELKNLVTSSAMVRALTECGVDVSEICEEPGLVFKGEETLEVSELVSEILALRSTNAATVKDMFMLKRALLDEIEAMMSVSTEVLYGGFRKL